MPVALPTAFCQHCRDEEIVWSKVRGGRIVHFCLGCDEPVGAQKSFRTEAELASWGFSFGEPALPEQLVKSCGGGSCGSGCGCSTGGGCSTCSKVDTCHKVH